MFSGIVAAIGTVTGVAPVASGMRVRVDAGGLGLADVARGDSIAVNGVCLTVVALAGNTFEADVSPETLRTTAGYAAADRVNLEKALRLADRLGGHFVSGHVDGVGTVTGVESAGVNRVLAFALPPELARYVARKGSITVNGVSLTVNTVSGAGFAVNLIPHTLAATNLGWLAPGDRVNLEVDLLARYLERLAAGQ
ncbi:MAG: riboflavin synthase [Burkholderiales bacterium]|nr:riboflavin synthase [Burkholderiales bacterium]